MIDNHKVADEMLEWLNGQTDVEYKELKDFFIYYLNKIRNASNLSDELKIWLEGELINTVRIKKANLDFVHGMVHVAKFINKFNEIMENK